MRGRIIRAFVFSVALTMVACLSLSGFGELRGRMAGGMPPMPWSEVHR